MTERLEKFLKEAKIKLMIGGIIGSVVLGGGAAVKAQAANNQNNTKSISTEASYDEGVMGASISYEDYEYAEQLKDFLNGDLTLREATKTGGATEFLYNAIARGISGYSGIDYDIVRDAIINLNLDSIAGWDEEQMYVLYPEGVNYTRLEENTVKFLYKYQNLGYASLNHLVGEQLDFEIIQTFDNRISYFSALTATHYTTNDYAALNETLDFFLANGEINGHKFEELTDCGKKIALIAYERISGAIERDYHKYDNVNEVPVELAKVYNLTRAMDVLSVSTMLKCPNLITSYYNFSRELIAPPGVVLYDFGEEHFNEYVNGTDGNVLSFAGKTDKLKSTFFINNFDNIAPQKIIKIFGQNIDINQEFVNMEEYLNAVLEHNSTHGVEEHVSLGRTITEHDSDKLYIAHLESYYKAIKYQLETNQLDESLVSSVLKWVLNYYNGFYIDNSGKEVKYTENLSNSGMLMANNLLNQYKVLLGSVKANNNEVNVLIEEVNKINLSQETKTAEQSIYDDFDKLQKHLNYYIVVKGDALWKIAQRYGMTAQQLYDLNRDVIGDDPNLILPGQELKTNPNYDYDQPTR